MINNTSPIIPLPEGEISSGKQQYIPLSEGIRGRVRVSDLNPQTPSNWPFYTTKLTGSVTGQGLTLSHDIIKALGRELKVESPPANEAGQAGGETGEEGKGTDFTIKLPMV